MKTVLAAIAVTLAFMATAAADGGLRATGRVRSAEPGPAIAVSLGTGYGFTEAVLDAGDAHHRVGGAAAIAVRLAKFLELGGELSGRYDKHTGAQPDDGFVGDPRLWARVGGGLGDHRWLALRLGLWLPGADAPSIETGAISFDAAAVVTLGSEHTAFTATAGFRLDRSSESVDPDALSAPDRIGLGLSEANAVLLGAGVTRHRGAWQLVGEASWDLLLGDDAPSALESPIRVGLGVRRALDASVTLEGLLEIGASSRPDLMDGSLIAIEPRVAATFGLSWRPRPAPVVVARRVVESPLELPDEPPPPPAPTTGSVHGRILDPDGAPLPGATVRLGERTVTTSDDGAFTFDELAPGSVEVTIERPGHESMTRTLTVTAGAAADFEVALARQKQPSLIRGVIRNFSGKGLAAKVRIDPLGVEVTCKDDGSFEVEVPPGTYTVVVTMAGYDSQKRAVEVEDEGVFNANIELRKGRP